MVAVGEFELVKSSTNWGTVSLCIYTVSYESTVLILQSGSRLHLLQSFKFPHDSALIDIFLSSAITVNG